MPVFPVLYAQTSEAPKGNLRAFDDQGNPPLVALVLQPPSRVSGRTFRAFLDLVEDGADPGQPCLRWDKTPLWYLFNGWEGSRQEMALMVQWLLCHDADIDHDMQEEPGGPIGWVRRSVLQKQDAIAMAFIARINPDADPGPGHLPLVEALMCGVREHERIAPLVGACLDQGADPNRLFFSGKTALETALLHLEDVPLCERLLKAGASPRWPNAQGQTLFESMAQAEATSGLLSANWPEIRIAFERLQLEMELPGSDPDLSSRRPLRL